MKITLEHYDYKISVKSKHDDLEINEVIDHLIVPLLLSAGYQQDTIDNYFNK